ncbi:MAG: hypothetical protein IKJ93_04150 [Clostridia bacterium]|nr:hypothetical protein [Clostridia bacterium]
MKKIKILASLFLCIILCACMCTTVLAAPTPNVKISNASAMAGQEVTIGVSITGNPGIMAMTFSITYDKSQFEFIDFTKGFVSTPVYKNHSDKGYVAFSISETSDKTTSGNIISIKFKIKDNAKPGKYTIALGNPNYEKYGANIDNCFSNSKQDLIVPKITTGSITVESECDRIGHNFGGWTVTDKPSCTKEGLKTRTCARCGSIEEVTLPVYHDVENEWTVDKAATPQENGIMSKHCKFCDERFDEIIFTYEEIGGNDTENSEPGSSSSSNNNSSITNNSSTNDNSSVDENSSTNVNTSTDEDSQSSDSQTEHTDSETDSSANDGLQSSPNASSDNTNSDSANNSSNKKPTINNTVGSKNPISSVEGLKDYQDKFVDKEDEEPVEGESVIKPKPQEDSVDSNDNSSKEELKSSTFFTSTSGIILLILCIVLSLGILAFGAVLIIKNNKKSQE